MARAVLSALLGATLLPGALAAKDANTIVYATYGDWGWGASATNGQNNGANNTLLQNSAAKACYANRANTTFLSTAANGCVGNQGYYSLAGYSQLSQMGVAAAMAGVCTAAGGCDFLMNTGDNFYDLGITAGLTDTQWQTAYLNVYNASAFARTPILGTLGNHDYSVLATNAAASQIAYTGVDPTGRWYIPDHNYARTFTSASGLVSVQVVQTDSTPLHDRYLFSGASGGGYCTDASGADTVPNNNGVNAVINPGVTAANGFSGNLYNATNFACAFNWVTAAKVSGVGSGCKYASAELAPLATPAARAATYANLTATFNAGFGVSQYQVMFSHFPIVAGQQRLTPYYDSATAMLTNLGAAAPQVYYNGHDHIMALSTVSTLKSGATPIGFYTTGAGGVSDYSGSTGLTGGYATDAAALTAASAAAPYVAQPSGTVAAAAAYNPDVNFTRFWSNYNGFTLSTLNASMMKVEFYLLDCTQQYLGQPCASAPVGPLYTQYYPAKALTSTKATYVSASVTLGGYSVATFGSAQAAAFAGVIAAQLSVSASAVTVTGVTAAASSGRHMLQSGVTVAFTVATTTAAASGVASGIATAAAGPALVTAMQAAGLSSLTTVTVAAAPAAGATAPAAATLSPRAAASGSPRSAAALGLMTVVASAAAALL